MAERRPRTTSGNRGRTLSNDVHDTTTAVTDTRAGHCARHGAGDGDEPVVGGSFLQPRVAVVLGVPRRWHLVFFVCRLASIVPASWCCIWPALRFLVAELLLRAAGAPPDGGADGVGEARLRLIETALAVVWVCAPSPPVFLLSRPAWDARRQRTGH